MAEAGREDHSSEPTGSNPIDRCYCAEHRLKIGGAYLTNMDLPTEPLPLTNNTAYVKNM